MPFSLRKLTKLHLVALGFVALFGLAMAGWSATHWWNVSPKPVLATPPQGKITAADKPDRTVVQELLTLRPFGFDPAELTIPSGNFLLAVDNLTGVADLNLTLVEEKKNKLKDIKIESRNRDWREEIDLKTGIYILSEATHPEWTCRITVTDKVRGQ